MSVLFVTLVAAIMFCIYLAARNWSGAVINLTIGLGYHILSYYHHFLGGMEARGHASTSIPDLMFSAIVIGTLSTLIGFAAFSFHKCRARLGYETWSRLFIFFIFGCGLIVICLMLVLATPLSLEMTEGPTPT